MPNPPIYGVNRAAEVLGTTRHRLGSFLRNLPEAERSGLKRMHEGRKTYYWPNANALLQWFQRNDTEPVVGIDHAGRILRVDPGVVKDTISRLRKTEPLMVPGLSKPYKDAADREKRSYYWESSFVLQRWWASVCEDPECRLPDLAALSAPSAQEELPLAPEDDDALPSEPVPAWPNEKTLEVLNRVWACVEPFMSKAGMTKLEFADSLLLESLESVEKRLEREVTKIVKKKKVAARRPPRRRDKPKHEFRSS